MCRPLAGFAGDAVPDSEFAGSKPTEVSIDFLHVESMLYLSVILIIVLPLEKRSQDRSVRYEVLSLTRQKICIFHFRLSVQE